jgi:hypothetical protein
MFMSLQGPWRKAICPAGFVISLLALSTVAAVAQERESPLPEVAQAATTVAPYSLFEYSALTGSGNTVTASYVPVTLANGTTIYKNLTIEFAVDSSGNLTIATGYPIVTAAPTLLVTSFAAGTYLGPSSDSNYTITVAGPGVTSGGATEWSFATPSGANYATYPGTGTWYVGPLTSNPLYSRLKAAGITSTAWSYGVSTSYYDYTNWPTNGLIGVSQIGNTITFVSFTNSNGVDRSTPYDSITYTFK